MNCRYPWIGFWLLCFAFSGLGFSQSGIGGSAAVTLQEGVADCGGNCVTVEVFADVTGLTGVGGDAGLNAFALAFDIDRGDIFASARSGTDPALDWGFLTTNRDLVAMTDRLVLVGAVAEMQAPNQNYLLATLVFCGSVGDMTLTFVPGESSLGSRVVAGDGPGNIAINGPAPLTVNLTSSFPLDWGTGISQWLADAPNYDLVDPLGRIDLLDLTKLVNCGQP